MRFLPTIDLWDNAIGTAVHTGRLKLQRGQWVRCGNSRPSRFVCVRPGGTIWAVHPEGDRGVTPARFKTLCDVAGKVPTKY